MGVENKYQGGRGCLSCCMHGCSYWTLRTQVIIGEPIKQLAQGSPR